MKFSKQQTIDSQQSAGGSASNSRTKVADKDYDEETGRFWFDFTNGQKVEGNLNELPQALVVRLALHGILQKIGDSYASAKGNVNEAQKSAQAVLDALKSGNWGPEREGGGGPRLGELAEAVARLKQIPLEAAREAVEKADDKQRTTLRSHPRIKATIAQIRYEKSQAELQAAGDNATAEINI